MTATPPGADLAGLQRLVFEPDDDRYVAELTEYVAIPSVSRDADAATMRRAAEWIAAKIDFADPQLVDTGGHPAVVGAWLGAPDAPTVVVQGGISAGRDVVADEGEAAGWWQALVGEGRAIDLNRYRVLSIDWFRRTRWS